MKTPIFGRGFQCLVNPIFSFWSIPFSVFGFAFVVVFPVTMGLGFVELVVMFSDRIVHFQLPVKL